MDFQDVEKVIFTIQRQLKKMEVMIHEAKIEEQIRKETVQKELQNYHQRSIGEDLSNQNW